MRLSNLFFLYIPPKVTIFVHIQLSNPISNPSKYMKAIYKRVLLKLSGESLQGEQGYGIDPKRVNDYCEQIKELVDAGVQVAIVIGGGNISAALKALHKVSTA